MFYIKFKRYKKVYYKKCRFLFLFFSYQSELLLFIFWLVFWGFIFFNSSIVFYCVDVLNLCIKLFQCFIRGIQIVFNVIIYQDLNFMLILLIIYYLIFVSNMVFQIGQLYYDLFIYFFSDENLSLNIICFFFRVFVLLGIFVNLLVILFFRYFFIYCEFFKDRGKCLQLILYFYSLV